MFHQVYINSIFEPIVKPWIEQGDNFVLEENSNSGHETGKTKNAVKKWKKKHNLEHYLNCALFSDLAPIENC